MSQKLQSASGYYQNQPGVLGLTSEVSWQARKKMFAWLMEVVQPTSETTVLDVGVTSDRRQDSNFFEKLYSHSSKITAVGLEDAYFLEEDFPGLKYIKADGLSLPFLDKSFDLVVSFAVIEHVGSRSNQRVFVSELCRIGKTVFITTPNRWYPIEFHTILPLVHWLPSSWFRMILRWLGKDFFAKEENLNLLDEKELSKMFPANSCLKKNHFKLFGIVSNLVFYCVSKEDYK
jgi:2-polyprenyl-3-methyl-5-hydroxy-6-metoxy-1,4-benzoquinol methylase